MSDRWWCGNCKMFVELNSTAQDESHEHNPYMLTMWEIPKGASKLLKAEGAAEEREGIGTRIYEFGSMGDRWWCGNCNKPIGWSEKSGDIHKSCGCIVEYIDPAIAEFFKAEGAAEEREYLAIDFEESMSERWGSQEVADHIRARSKEVDRG